MYSHSHPAAPGSSPRPTHYQNGWIHQSFQAPMPVHDPRQAALEFCWATSHLMDDVDQTLCDQFYESQEKQAEVDAFLDDQWLSENPPDPNVGCFIHQDGQALIWDDENGAYVPVGSEHVRWGHPAICPPVLWDTRYSCDIDDVTNLQPVHPASAPAQDVVEEAEPESTATEGSRLAQNWVDLSDRMDSLLKEDEEKEDEDEGLPLTRTISSDGPGSTFGAWFFEKRMHEILTERPGGGVDDSASTASTNSSTMSWSEMAKESRPVQPAPAQKIPVYARKKSPEPVVTDSGQRTGVVKITMVKKDRNTGRDIFYVGTFEDGETAYMPMRLLQVDLKWGTFVTIEANVTEGHLNKWRAARIVHVHPPAQ
mgnify:CR=1 FL=1